MAKRHRSRKTTSPTYSQGLMATKERQHQNGGVVVEAIHERDGNKVYTHRHCAMFTSILDAYLWNRSISETEHAAGEKFGREYSRSVLKIKVNDIGSGSQDDVEMAYISAINGNHLLRKAFEVLSFTQREILISVCVDNKSAGTTRKVNYLGTALRILAKKWNM
jgi:hypothetical protein